MQTVTRYKANDGTEFTNAVDAVDRDALLIEIEKANAIMKRAVDDGCSFTNGHGYIQHTPEEVNQFHIAVAVLIRLEYNDEHAQTFLKNPRGIIHRILDDPKCPLGRTMNRVFCIDDRYREWGQPFYAMNPDQGDQVECSRA